MDNYYQLLEIGRSAGTEEIEEKIRKQMRMWSKRTNNPDLIIRQDAERKVQLLSEARKILTDPAKRAEYDKRLKGQPAGEQPKTQKADDAGWLDQARRHIVTGDYLSAAYAAQRACDEDRSNPDAWGMLAHANLQLGRLGNALVEANRAVHLAPGRAALHYELACVYEQMQNWDQALSEFEHVRRLDPGNEGAQFGIGAILQQKGRHLEAIRLLEDLYARSADKEMAGRQLGWALAVAAEAAPRVQFPHAFVVTSASEVTTMRQYVAWAREVTQDMEVNRAITEIERALAWAAARHWTPRAWMHNGCLVSIAVGVVGIVALSVVGALASGSIGTLFALLFFWGVVLGPVAVLIYLTSFVPGWKINQHKSRNPAHLPGPQPW